MRSHPGVASQMFRALAEEGINLQMISTSEDQDFGCRRRKIHGTRGPRPAQTFGLDQADRRRPLALTGGGETAIIAPLGDVAERSKDAVTEAV